jgi:hypothetical protein
MNRRAVIEGSIFDVGLVEEPRQKKARSAAPSRPTRDEEALYKWVQAYLEPLVKYDKTANPKQVH